MNYGTGGASRRRKLVHNLLLEHAAAGELPTSLRFLFYELVARGDLPKSQQSANRVSGCATWLRERGDVPWDWIVDETRSLDVWGRAESARGYLLDELAHFRLDPWDGSPPLVITESRSLAGVLRPLAMAYRVDIASTNGQAGGFLHTDIAPALFPGREVLYLGDLDYAGIGIEANTTKVLRGYEPELRWKRLAITDAQRKRSDLPSTTKVDKRFRPPRRYEAWETEALGQGPIIKVVTKALDKRLPRPLAEVRELEQAQRAAAMRKVKRWPS